MARLHAWATLAGFSRRGSGEPGFPGLAPEPALGLPCANDFNYYGRLAKMKATGIKSRFVTLIGGTLPSPDPFTATLVPEVSKYCK